MSAALRCCACSTRQRVSFFAGFALNAASKMFERFAVGAIADRVHAQLVVVQHREACRLLDRGDGRGVEPAALRLVGIRLEQPRAARAERAVDRALDRADGEMPLAVVDHPVLREAGRDPFVRIAHHHPQTHTELAGVDLPLHPVDRGEVGSGVVEGRDPLREHFLVRELEDLAFARFDLGRRRLRCSGAALDQAGRGLAQQPGGIARTRP